MRRSSSIAALALVLAPILSACNEPSVPAKPAGWDRTAARREVLAATLDAITRTSEDVGATSVVAVNDTLEPPSTYEESHTPPKGRSPADLVSLPNGRRVYRLKMEGLDVATFEDWIAHTGPMPAPRDLSSAHPIEWHSSADSGKQTRASKATVLIDFSDVGFSPTHDQALMQITENGDSCSSGSWILLQLKGDTWEMIKRARTFIGCGPPPANITPVDR